MQSPGTSGELEEELADLLAACDDAMASGEMPTSAILLKRNSRAEPDLQRDLECMNLLRMVMPRRKPSSENQPATLWHDDPKLKRPKGIDGDSIPRRIGRFLVQKELGRGGCGIVFLARDPMLDREVAVKVPRAEVLAKPHLKARFMQEGRTAASLDHANIVQVYEAGMEDDLCYIASAYCPGLTLAKWLAQRSEPVPVHVAGTIIMHLADATEHAHSRGVIHRDLKPANILLGSADPADTEELHQSDLALLSESAMNRREGAVDLGFIPKITDFGLAKNEAGESGHTISGTIMGTPSYMAPEQADGKTNTATKSSDVYSLGAILYELLTGKPPFRADTVLVELNRVVHEAPLPPTKLRPKIPDDLETICLKCLEKEPAMRYRSAGALADDLGRFLSHEPIDAKPLSFFGRYAAWRRRKPLVAKLSATIAFVSILGFGGVFWQWQRAEENAYYAHSQWRRAEENAVLAQAERDQARIERNIAMEERKRAEEHQKRAETNFKRGQDILDQLSKLGSDMLRKPHMDSAARAVLQKAALFYTGFLEEKSEDPLVRSEAANACARAGRLYFLLENDIQSEEMLRKASDILMSLIQTFPEQRNYQSRLVSVSREHGRVLRRLGKDAAAEKVFGAANKIAEDATRALPNDFSWKVQLANTLVNWIADRPVDPFDPTSEVAVRRAVQLTQSAIEMRPSSTLARMEFALCKEELGLLFFRRADFKNAIVECQQSANIRDEYRVKTEYLDADLYLARCYNELAFFRREIGLYDAANADSDKARALTSKLVSNYPERGWFQREHVNTFRWRALSLNRQGKNAEALAELREGLKYLPEDKLLNRELAWLLVTLSDPKLRDVAGANAAIELAVKAAPDNPNSLGILALVQYRQQNYKAALNSMSEALKQLGGKPVEYWEVPVNHFLLALIHQKMGESAKAKQAYSQGLAAQKRPITRQHDYALMQKEAAELLKASGNLP